jgi:hypothetical protein
MLDALSNTGNHCFQENEKDELMRNMCMSCDVRWAEQLTSVASKLAKDEQNLRSQKYSLPM